jgi:hypothetical protein
MTPFEGFAIAMNQFKAEAEDALLDVYPDPEECQRRVNHVLEKIKVACAEESNIAVFLACGQIIVNLTKERVLRGEPI